MKKQSIFLALCCIVLLPSCRTRVPPNNWGVLMENFGKHGKSDYSLVAGRVSDWGRSRQLFLVPAWEQRAKFESDMHLEAANRTNFTSTPSYSYIIPERKAVDVVFHNAQLDDDNFMPSLENNVLETRIYDIMKDISRKYTSDTLMADGGNMKYENEVRGLVIDAFDSIGIKLMTFTAPLIPTDKVKERIDTRNEVNTNISVLDQQIAEQRKKNELAELQAQELVIRSRGLTPQILQEKFYEAWKVVKQPIYGQNPFTLFKTVQ